MLFELLTDVTALFAITLIAHIIGYRKVYLMDRPEPICDEDYLIAPPRRNSDCVKQAKELSRRYARRNARARIETESLIVLPSTTLAWTVGIIEAVAFTALFWTNHFHGIVQFLIGERIYSSDMLFDMEFATAVFLMPIICLAIAAWIAEAVIPRAAKAHASAIADKRLRKGRTARFAQDLSVGEIAVVAKWAAQEEIAEKREAWAERRSQKQLKAEIIQFPKLPMAANK